MVQEMGPLSQCPRNCPRCKETGIPVLASVWRRSSHKGQCVKVACCVSLSMRSMNTQSYYIMDSEILYPLYPLYHIISYFSECIRMYANYIVYLSCSPLDSTVVRPTVLGTARPTSRKSSWGSTWKIGAAPRNATRHWSQRRRRSALALRPLEKSLLRCLEKTEIWMVHATMHM